MSSESENLRPPGVDPSRGWRPIHTAPRDGTWVWGEWPRLMTVASHSWRASLRIVAPMCWIKPDEIHVEHWCIGGRFTPGDDPVRWAPMSEPPEEHEAFLDDAGVSA